MPVCANWAKRCSIASSERELCASSWCTSESMLLVAAPTSTPANICSMAARRSDNSAWVQAIDGVRVSSALSVTSDTRPKPALLIAEVAMDPFCSVSRALTSCRDNTPALTPSVSDDESANAESPVDSGLELWCRAPSLASSWALLGSYSPPSRVVPRDWLATNPA